MSPPNIKNKGANKPLDSCHLLDTLAEAEHISTALEEIIDAYGDKLPKIVIKHLTTLSRSANYIHQQGQRQVVKVSPITNLLQSYAIRVKSNRQNEPPRPAHITVSDAMWRSTVYVKKCDKQNSTASSAPKQLPSPSSATQPASKKPRRSERVVVSPDPDMDEDNVVAKMVEGHKWWTKDTLCKAMYQLESTGLTKKFVEAVLSSGKTDKMATSYPGITRMYNKWKTNGHVNDRGRPSVMQLSDAADAVKSVLDQCSHSSNNFHMKDMKKAFEEKIKEKAENDGLDPNGIDCRISEKTAKHYMTAISMQEDNTLALNDNKEIVPREKRRRKLEEQHSNAITTRSTIQHILQRNAEVEAELKTKIMGEVIADASVQDFLDLTPAQKLKDFIHARKFTGDVFHTSQLTGTSGKLNKTLHRQQTAQEIERNCSYEKPCLVWLAWMLRDAPIVLEIPPEPVLNLQVTMPKFNVVYAGPKKSTPASEYLDNTVWVEGVKRSFKGVTFVPIDDELKKRADILATLLVARLDCHVSERVDSSRQDHWTIDFTRANITVMAAAMCLVGHIVEDIGSYKLRDRLIQLPDWSDSTFQIMSDSIKRLEGCYLFYDVKKSKWVRSGKTSGEGDAACFEGRGKQHETNAQSRDEMRHSKFYRSYPAREVAIDGVREGYFENLQMYCAMAFNSSLTDGSLEPIYNHSDSGVFVWTDQAMSELMKKEDDLQKLQRDAVAYLWELCYDLSLANGENVSESPGFEGFGLRVNNNSKKRKSRE